MSLDGNYDTGNIFAKILRGEIPSAKVYEDEKVLSFMDAFPQSRGHTLVIPKAPSRNLFDTEPATLGYVIEQTQNIGRAVRDVFEPDGITITQFNGAPAGQTVFHLHFHIIPRYIDMANKPHASGHMADFEDLKAQAAKIEAALKTN